MFDLTNFASTVIASHNSIQVSIYNALIFLGAIIIFGSLCGHLIEKINLPSITGYIIAGLIIGPIAGVITSAAGYGEYQNFVTQAEDYLKIISSVAIGFIAFSIGTEFWLPKFKESGKRILLITVCEPIVAFILVTFLVTVIGHKELYFAMTLGAIATATAPAPTLLIVKRYKARGEVTDTMVPVIGLDDAVGTIIFAIAIAVATAQAKGGGFKVTSGILTPLIEILGSAAIGSIIGIIVGLSGKYIFNKYTEDDKEQSYLGVILVVVFLSIVISHYCKYEFKNDLTIEFSDILVPMFAGFAFTNMVNKSTYKLQSRATDHFTGPLMIAFFTLAGANLRLSDMSVALPIACLYIVGRALGKMSGGTLGAMAGKSSKKIVHHIGLTLLPQGGVELGLVISAKEVFDGLGMQDVGSTVQAVIIIGVFFFELVGPVSTKLALQHAGELHYKDAEGEPYHF